MDFVKFKSKIGFLGGLKFGLWRFTQVTSVILVLSDYKWVLFVNNSWHEVQYDRIYLPHFLQQGIMQVCEWWDKETISLFLILSIWDLLGCTLNKVTTGISGYQLIENWGINPPPASSASVRILQIYSSCNNFTTELEVLGILPERRKYWPNYS
jgi:hypothetical protein